MNIFYSATHGHRFAYQLQLDKLAVACRCIQCAQRRQGHLKYELSLIVERAIVKGSRGYEGDYNNISAIGTR